MKIEFDPAKNEKNVRDRSPPFSKAGDFDFATSVRVEDVRRDYKETRIVAYGFIGKRLHVLCFKREIKKYEEATKTTH